MLKLLKPKKILLVVSYGKEGLILAAREIGIETIEIQHGVITQDHLGYSFEKGITKKSFPDTFWLMGKYWYQSIYWSINKDRIKILGYPYFDMKKRKYSNVIKRNQVLFLSQGTIGSKLSQFASKFADLQSNETTIIYKLHPGEVVKWEIDYPWLLKVREEGKIIVIGNDKPDLYQLMAESRWQIGVYSTALFEGFTFKCCTFLVNLPGVEYMESLISNNDVKLVNNPEDIELKKDCVKANNIDTDDFFSKPNYNLIGL